MRRERMVFSRVVTKRFLGLFSLLTFTSSAWAAPGVILFDYREPAQGAVAYYTFDLNDEPSGEFNVGLAKKAKEAHVNSCKGKKEFEESGREEVGSFSGQRGAGATLCAYIIRWYKLTGKEYDLKANTDYNSPEKRHDVHHISHGQWVIRTPDPACSRIEPGKDTEKRIAELKFTCGGITYYSGTVALGTGAGGNGLLVDLGDSLLGSSLVE